MELFFLMITACINNCHTSESGYIKPFETLDACVAAARKDQEGKRRFASMRNSPIYLYECRSESRTVAVPKQT